MRSLSGDALVRLRKSNIIPKVDDFTAPILDEDRILLMLVQLQNTINSRNFNSFLDVLSDTGQGDVAGRLREQRRDMEERMRKFYKEFKPKQLPNLERVRAMVMPLLNGERDWSEVGQNLGIDGDILGRMDQRSVGPLMMVLTLAEDFFNSTSENCASTLSELRVTWFQQIAQVEKETLIKIISGQP
ncbi:unnamed protein product [Darwinula stevensoni]|uniref:Uncharacterized protein n=1 Tax=Darwinula stevensoni TaxID=69355 RepID=A0A7R9FRB3_9CRUS|nr:unnamed protein product [Darwinula stevensoni]CAG0900985.1 unnamed protein product [Darwinula stevensoni]